MKNQETKVKKIKAPEISWSPQVAI